MDIPSHSNLVKAIELALPNMNKASAARAGAILYLVIILIFIFGVTVTGIKVLLPSKGESTPPSPATTTSQTMSDSPGGTQVAGDYNVNQPATYTWSNQKPTFHIEPYAGLGKEILNEWFTELYFTASSPIPPIRACLRITSDEPVADINPIGTIYGSSDSDLGEVGPTYKSSWCFTPNNSVNGYKIGFFKKPSSIQAELIPQ